MTSCRKFLDAKPDIALVVPSKISDLQALLDDNSNIFNLQYGAYGEGSADNYYCPYTLLSGLNEANRNLYTWGEELVFESTPNGWDQAYKGIMRANIALEEIEKIAYDQNTRQTWDNVKGTALFFRAFTHWRILVNFAVAYDEQTALKDPGIPLRLNGNFNETSVRSSVQACYNRIIEDLRSSIPLLPALPQHVLRPAKAAAYAALARTYLSMRRYEEAAKYADSSLQLQYTLMDYSKLNGNSPYPVPQFNEEVVYQVRMGMPALINNTNGRIDTMLYASYHEHDLRKQLYFARNSDGTYGFRGGYYAGGGMFTGIAVDEMYLTRAECYARSGRVDLAMSDLNTLMVKRWKQEEWHPLEAGSSKEAVDMILTERRKELLFRDLRWMDIKRLNKEREHQISLRRDLNGTIITLPPNDPRYALPFPRDVIRISGMPQNAR